MKPKTTPDICRLFISEHLFIELDGLFTDLEVCAPSYIRFPVEGPKGIVFLSFCLTGKDLKGFRYEYKYKGAK